MKALKYGLISDTHGFTHPDLFQIFEGVDAILHAGDVGDESVLSDLQQIAPVFAVRGNVDYQSPDMPDVRVETFPFGKVVITHSDLVPDKQRSPRGLAQHFKKDDPAVILYGHTHLPYLGKHDGIWVVNPGPAGRPRFNDRPTVALMIWGKDAQDDLLFVIKELGKL